MLLATALALLITGCNNGAAFTVQNKPAAVAPKPSPIISSFWNWAEEKLSMQPKFVTQEILLKRNFSNCSRLLGFITLAFNSLEAVLCIALSVMSCPSIWATLSTLLINILLGSFQLFLHSDQPLWGEIIPFSSVLPVGGGCIIHAGGGGGFTHKLTDCFDVQPTTTSGNIITQSIIFSFSIS